MHWYCIPVGLCCGRWDFLGGRGWSVRRCMVGSGEVRLVVDGRILVEFSGYGGSVIFWPVVGGVRDSRGRWWWRLGIYRMFGYVICVVARA